MIYELDENGQRRALVALKDSALSRDVDVSRLGLKVADGRTIQWSEVAEVSLFGDIDGAVRAVTRRLWNIFQYLSGLAFELDDKRDCFLNIRLRSGETFDVFCGRVPGKTSREELQRARSRISQLGKAQE